MIQCVKNKLLIELVTRANSEDLASKEQCLLMWHLNHRARFAM